jgi:hypothetical protein
MNSLKSRRALGQEKKGGQGVRDWDQPAGRLFESQRG